jgi:hypothetical protein
MAQECSNEAIVSRETAIEKLKAFGIIGVDIYLIDIIPLIEMVWSDGKAQESEVELLDTFLQRHVKMINRMAGHEIIPLEHARRFVQRFLTEAPQPKLMEVLRTLVAPLRLGSTDSELNERIRHSLLAACLDIAASAVTEYPYGLTERFNASEKKCFFEIEKALG